MQERKERQTRWKKGAAGAIAVLVIGAGVWQVPTVKAAMLPKMTTAASWAAHVIGLPVRVPEANVPKEQQSTGTTVSGTTPPDSHYYYEASSTADSSSISVYYVKVPVRFNDEQDLLKKDGPLSESQRIATVSVTKLPTDRLPLAIVIPQDAKPFALLPGLTAYQKSEGTQIDWQKGGWGFEFVGSNAPSALAQVKQIAALKAEPFQQLAASGTVQITEGNRFLLFVTWDEGDLRYRLQTTDIQHLADMLTSMHEWQQSRR